MQVDFNTKVRLKQSSLMLHFNTSTVQLHVLNIIHNL